jgi:protein-S-isoprenylcysteine O-methyltransferase Ste14
MRASEDSTVLRFIRVVCFALTLTVWWWAINRQFSQVLLLLNMFGGILGLFPVVWIGRRVLDVQPTPDRATWVSTFLHFTLMILLGTAIIAAIKIGPVHLLWALPLPSEIGLALMVVMAPAVLSTVLSLALHGLGAPFAIALTRRLATSWLYAWTSNPMVLSLLLFLIGLGFWLQSTLFVLWVVVLFAPAMLVYLKVYEERELEIRFGASYLEYRANTPILWPRKPRIDRHD